VKLSFLCWFIDPLPWRRAFCKQDSRLSKCIFLHQIFNNIHNVVDIFTGWQVPPMSGGVASFKGGFKNRFVLASQMTV